MGAEWRTLSWQKDKWSSQNGLAFKYDKLDHFVGSMALSAICEQINAKNGLKMAVAAGFFWEVKDAIVPWEKYGRWGGEGFSSKDLIADIGGIILSHYIRKFLTKITGGQH